MSISMKWSLVLKPIDTNSEKVEGFYKAKILLMILHLGLPHLFSVI